MLWFSEALEPNFCEVEVLDSAGNRVDEGRATADAGDRKVLHVLLRELQINEAFARVLVHADQNGDLFYRLLRKRGSSKECRRQE